MIGYAHADNAHVQRVGKEIRTATDLYDEVYQQPLDYQTKVNTLNNTMRSISQEMRGRRTAAHRARPLQSETELIWNDRQYAKIRRSTEELIGHRLIGRLYCMLQVQNRKVKFLLF